MKKILSLVLALTILTGITLIMPITANAAITVGIAAEPQDTKDRLQALVNANAAKSESGYTAATWAIFSAAMSDAEALIANSNDLAELTAAETALINAVNGLVRIDKLIDEIVAVTDNSWCESRNNDYVNNGGQEVLWARRPLTETRSGSNSGYRAYVKFPIENIDATVSTIDLRLYRVSGRTDAGLEYQIAVANSNWIQGENLGTDTTQAQRDAKWLSWRVQPGFITDIPTKSILRSASGTSDNAYITLPVTDLVQAAKGKGLTEITFVIGDSLASNGTVTVFQSSRAANPPKLEVKSSTSLAQLKNQDLNAINITDYLNGIDTVNVVTQSLKALPLTGSVNGYPITWTSSEPSIISSNGTFTAPVSSTPVTLTAAINVDGVSFTKEFVLTAVTYSNFEKDCMSLSFDLIKNANLYETSVVSNLVLPNALTHGSTVSWSSDKPNFIQVDGTTGKVTRNGLAKTAEDVTLTAAISENGGNGSLIKTFNLRVPGDMYTIDECKAGTTVPFAASDNLEVRTHGDSGATGWMFDQNGRTGQYLIYRAGAGNGFKATTVVNNPGGDMTFYVSSDNETYTPFTNVSKVTSGSGYATATYTSGEPLPAGTRFLRLNIPNTNQAWRHSVTNVSIFNKPSDNEIKFSDIIGNNLSASAIIENLNLPTTFAADNSVISWASSNTAMITNAGAVVSRPSSQDTTVTLTATITLSSGAVTVKKYDVIVKTYEADLRITKPNVYYIRTGNIKTNITDNPANTSIANGQTIRSEVDFINLTSSSKNVYVVMAFYSKSGQLLDMAFEQIEIGNHTGQTQAKEISVVMSQSNDLYEECVVKSFVLEPEALAPLSEMFSVTRRPSI